MIDWESEDYHPVVDLPDKYTVLDLSDGVWKTPNTMYSIGKYDEFSLKKSISACVLAKSKIIKEITPQEARNICEKEIRGK